MSCPSDLLRHLGEPPALHLRLPLRDVQQGRGRPAAHRPEELRPEAWRHREVSAALSPISKLYFSVCLTLMRPVCPVLQGAGPEAAHLPGHRLLRPLWQRRVPLGETKAAGVLSVTVDHIPVVEQSV